MTAALSNKTLKEAKRQLKEMAINLDHDDLVFVDEKGNVQAITPETDYFPGMKGQFLRAPIVVVIFDVFEQAEDVEGNDYTEESVYLEEYSAFEDIPGPDDGDDGGEQFAVGAFVYVPTANGELEKKPRVLRSKQELQWFMEHWGMSK